MAYTTSSAQQPLARSLMCILALATTLALDPGDTLADVRDRLIAE
jgi:hypothetical protein